MDPNGIIAMEIKQEIADTQQPSTNYLEPIEIEDDVKPEPDDFPADHHQYRTIIAINHNFVGNGMKIQKVERPIVHRCTGRISVGNYRRFRDIRGDRGVRDNLGGVHDAHDGENVPNLTTNGNSVGLQFSSADHLQRPNTTSFVISCVKDYTDHSRNNTLEPVTNYQQPRTSPTPAMDYQQPGTSPTPTMDYQLPGTLLALATGYLQPGTSSTPATNCQQPSTVRPIEIAQNGRLLCPVCDETYANRSSLQKHNKTQKHLINSCKQMPSNCSKI